MFEALYCNKYMEFRNILYHNRTMKDDISFTYKGQGSRRDKIGPVTKINEIWQYCMCMSSVTENDSF